MGVCLAWSVASGQCALADEKPSELVAPDALVVTSRLSQLPKAILSVPLLKDLLTEDFLFYYQTGEGYLGFQGALRRISFEHDLGIGDRLSAYLMDTPAEVALWKGRDGKLDEFMVVVNQSGLKSLVEMVAKAALDDRQLSALAERPSVYVLRYAGERKLYLTVVNDQLFLFSRPDMPLPTPDVTATWTERVSRFFGTASAVGVFARLFGPPSPGAVHSITFSAPYLSFGYSRFFPSLRALRFDFTARGWRTSWLASPTTGTWPMDTASLWHAVPHSPALCVAVPVDKEAVGSVLRGELAGRSGEVDALLGNLRGPVALCWYAKSKLFTPLVVARLGDGAVSREFLKSAFDALIGTHEAGQYSPGAAAPGVGPVPQTKSYFSPLDVKEKDAPSGVEWTREVSSRYGMTDGAASPAASKLRSKRLFRVAAASWRRHLLFSADDRLVEDAMAVLEKRYPAASDGLKEKAAALIVFPSELATLLKSSTEESLPASQESLFRGSVSRFLFPALERMEEYPGYSLGQPKVAAGRATKWGEARWKAVAQD